MLISKSTTIMHRNYKHQIQEETASEERGKRDTGERHRVNYL